MRKLFFLSLLFSVSVSFSQTKNTQIVADSSAASGSPTKEDVLNDTITIYNLSEVEVKPEFAGGMEKFYVFVANKYQMPDEVGLRGEVFLTFVVERDGSLTGIKVRRDIGFGTGNEAVRVLLLSQKWIPAELNRKKVRCAYSLSIPIAT